MPKKIRSTLVFAGFTDGFSSPFRVFGRTPLKLRYRHYDTVSKAWHGVGEEISEATRVEGKKLGKSPDSEARRLGNR